MTFKDKFLDFINLSLEKKQVATSLEIGVVDKDLAYKIHEQTEMNLEGYTITIRPFLR